MRIDELLKHLENVETDEDNTEKHEIAEYLARTFSVDDSIYIYYIMTKDRKIYEFDSYGKLLDSNKVSPNDAYVYVENYYLTEYYSARYFYPLIDNVMTLVDAYLSKLGFYGDSFHIMPVTGLKYYAVVTRFINDKRIVVEVADIDNAAINTNLPTLIRGSTKHIDDSMVREILFRVISQKLFAGYDFRKAEEIIYEYFDDDWISFANSVSAINKAYNQIFQPYRVEYHLKKKQIIASYERTPSSPPPNSPYSEEE